MADNFDENVSIVFQTRADTKGADQAASALDKTTKATEKQVEAFKKLEDQAKRTNAALASGNNPSASLATGGANTAGARRAAQLRDLERQAGLRTENSMRAEDDERRRQQQRRQQFLNEAYAKQDRASQIAGDVRNEAAENRAGAIRTAGAGIFTAIGTAATIAAKGIQEYADKESAIAGMDAALAKHGQLTQEVSEQVLDLAHTLSKDVAQPMEVWLRALTQLTQFGADTSNLDKLAVGVENLAGIMKGDTTRAAMALSKAMEGNFDMMREWGIIVPKAASQAEKLESALAQAAEKGAGQLRAKAQTLTGQLTNLKSSFGILLESIGSTIARTGFLQDGMKALGFVADTLAMKIGGVYVPMSNLSNVASSSSQRLNEVRAAAQQAAAEFNSIEEAAKRASAALDRQREATDGLLSAQNRIADAQTSAALAGIDEQEAAGRMTPKTAAKARAEIRKKAAEERLAREQAAERERIAANERRINQLGNFAGLAQGEREALMRRMGPLTEAQRTRAEAADAENAATRAEDALPQNRSLLSNLWAFHSAIVTGDSGFMARQNQLASNAAAARADANIRGAEARGIPSNLSSSELVSANNRIAQLESQLAELEKVIRNEVPRLQDQNSQSRINIDANAGVFTAEQREQRSQLVAELSQMRGTNESMMAEVRRFLQFVVSNQRSTAEEVRLAQAQIRQIEQRERRRPR